jgi:hypothetical protein
LIPRLSDVVTHVSSARSGPKEEISLRQRGMFAILNILQFLLNFDKFSSQSGSPQNNQQKLILQIKKNPAPHEMEEEEEKI